MNILFILYFSANWVIVNGQVLKEGVIIITAINDSRTEMPEFGLIKHIFVLPTKEVLLGVNMLEVLEYTTDHSYSVKFTQKRKLVKYGDLCSTQLLHAVSSFFIHSTIKFVTLKYAIL